jgi:general secretion pathway protein A
MYEAFFGFRERPFDLSPNPRFIVLTESHREALSNLEYGIASRKGITLLIGDAGSGKTTMIRAAMVRQPTHVHSVHLQNPALTRDEFVQLMAARFGLSEAAGDSKAVFLLELETLLRERLERGESTVLIVDEGQSLSTELLEEIRLLVNMETNDEKLLCVIMAGQPELAARLNEQGLRQLKQRIALRCQLRPLALPETAAYLAGRIRAAGGVGVQVFTRDAVELIHECAKGLPRMISVVADNALLTGFAAGQRLISSELVREVRRDFNLDAEPAARPVNGQRARLGPAAPNDGQPGHRLLEEAKGDTPEPVSPQPIEEPLRAAAGAGRWLSLFRR